jgi:hypothetical protein
VSIANNEGLGQASPLTPGSYVTYLQLTRIHPHHQGIATRNGLAVSIVCDPNGAGPYSDRWLRKGAILDYCGQGRKGDQEWNRYNAALRVAMEERRAVHVFEDLEEVPARYLYHGLWQVLSYHEAIDPGSGSRQFRFIVSSEPNPLIPATTAPMLGRDDASTDLPEPPARFLATTSRIIRDTRLSRTLKAAYGNRCQVCSRVQQIAPDKTYSEAHHLRPLGHPHDGPDVRSNILVLCAAHHVEFDYGAIAIDPVDELRLLAPFDASIHGRKVTLLPRHRLDPGSIRYHHDRIFEGKTTASPTSGPGRLCSPGSGPNSGELT